MEYNEYRSPRKREKKKSSIVVIALIFALIGSCIGSGLTYFLILEDRSLNGVSQESSGNNVVINTTSDVGIAEAVAKKAIPSVVGITTEGQIQSIYGLVETKGTGSGIVVDESGYILTNAHVVKLNNQVVSSCNVLLDDGTNLEGKVVWEDSSIDLAIVKIEPKKKLVAAELGDSSKIQIGETVIAIGNPIDIAYQRSVTQGIVSGLNRYVGQVSGGGYMTGLIQTDASINGGNSGGPLLNKNGEVIGINTVKVSSAEGLGFSIPINSVKPIIEQVIKTGTYKVVSLGIRPYETAALSRYYKMSNNGVIVLQVFTNSPAAEAGIKAGDIITKIDGQEISTVDALRAMLYKYKTSDTAKFTILRDKKEMELNVTFKDYEVNSDELEQKITIPSDNAQDSQQYNYNGGSQGNSDPFDFFEYFFNQIH